MQKAGSLRKTIVVIMVSIMFLVMTGCRKGEIIEVDPSEIAICIDLKYMEEKVYRLDLVYFLEDELMGGQAVSRVDEKPLDGEQIFRLTSEEFPEGSSRENFKFYIVVSGDRNGIKEMFSSAELMGHTNDSNVFTPQYGHVYVYRITGTYEDGFILEESVIE